MVSKKGEATTIEENKIDRQIYELYRLTEDEIKMVEGIRNLNFPKL